MLALELIDDLSRLAEIQDEWFRFVRSIGHLTPFQLPQWLMTWWSRFGNGRLHVLVFREGRQIAAVIPCFDHQWNGVQQRTLIGSGISDYLEPAISSEHLPAVLDGIRAHLETDSGWDVCDWQDLSGDTPLRSLELTGGLQVSGRDDTPCSEIRISESFEEFWQKRPKELRQNFRRDKKKAETAGRLEFAAVNQADPELLNALIQLHGARWQRRGEAGTIAANGSAEFLCDVAAQFADLGILQFFNLRLGGKIAAVILGFAYSNTLFFYLSGFDPEHETLGLGRILLGEALRDCFEKKYDAWNFLRGNERYKFHWGAQSLPKCRLIVRRDNPLGASQLHSHTD